MADLVFAVLASAIALLIACLKLLSALGNLCYTACLVVVGCFGVDLYHAACEDARFAIV